MVQILSLINLTLDSLMSIRQRDNDDGYLLRLLQWGIGLDID